MKSYEIEFCKQLAKGVARQFGSNCEVVVHDLCAAEPEHSVVVIENGHVTGRRLGDGPSHVVWEALKADPDSLEDRLSYLTRTEDGKLLKSSTMYVRNDEGKPIALFAINYDITMMKLMEDTIHAFTATEAPSEEPQTITHNVNDLLDELIKQSAKLVGKPVALMTKDDKVRAIRFLSDSGAMLITRSGDRIAKFFRISKYTLYFKDLSIRKIKSF